MTEPPSGGSVREGGVLNHIEDTISGVGAVYQRSKFLRECAAALNAWAVYVLNVADGVRFKPTTGNVVRLQGQEKTCLSIRDSFKIRNIL